MSAESEAAGLAIRDAELNDAAIIAEFNTRLAWESESKRLPADVVAAGVRALLEDPRHGRYFLACAGGEPVGQLMITHEWSDWRNGDLWWLQSVYVRPEFRRQGVFRRLMQHVRELVRNTPGVVGVRLYVEEHNQRALDSYERLGFHRAGYIVLQDVPGDLSIEHR